MPDAAAVADPGRCRDIGTGCDLRRHLRTFLVTPADPARTPRTISAPRPAEARVTAFRRPIWHHHGVPETWVVIPLYNEATGHRRRRPRGRARSSRTWSASTTAAPTTAGRRGPRRRGRRRPARGQPGPGRRAADRPDLRPARPGARYFVTFDADGQHQVSDAVAMVDDPAHGRRRRRLRLAVPRREHRARARPSGCSCARPSSTPTSAPRSASPTRTTGCGR